jgi:CRISPR/Cas system-associated exonuclease Cas4 (RecB family)
MICTTDDGTEVQERSADVRSYISPSRLNTWLRCPLAFKLRYIDGIRSPPSKSMFVGKMVHAGLECFYRHKQLGVKLPAGDVVQRMDACWEPLAVEENVSFKDAADEVKLRTQSGDLVAAYLVQVPVDEPTPTTVETKLEVPLVDPFTGEDLGIPLLGVVDLVVNGEDGPVVCDFKTSARSGSPVEIMHEVQLTAYAYLFRQLADETEAGLEIRSLIKTKVPKIEYHRYAARTGSHFRRFFQIVRQYLDDLDRADFVYRPGFGCTMCDFRDGPCVAALA